MIYNDAITLESLKNLSAQDFLTFGMHDVAYIRRVSVDGEHGFAIHAADGTPLSVMGSLAEARDVIHHNDLESAALH